MSDSVHNDAQSHIGEDVGQNPRAEAQASHDAPENPGGERHGAPEGPTDPNDPNYWQTLVVELMKRIPPVPAVVPPKDDKIADRVARRNPKTYDGKYDPVELEDWIRGMEKIFAVVEVPDEKKVNIGTYYLTGDADVWWGTVKERLTGPNHTWSKFVEELRTQFYPVALQRQKEKEFLALKMSGTMTVLQYAKKFMELARFAPEFVATERMKMRKFEEGLALYIRHQLAGQPITTYQELYDRAAEIERVKTELRAITPTPPKRKWNDRGTPIGNESVSRIRPPPVPTKGSSIGSSVPCGKCGRTNHATADCRVGTNQCLWCGSPHHAVPACPERRKAAAKGAASSVNSPRPGPPAPPRPATTGRAYVMSIYIIIIIIIIILSQ